MEEVKRIKAIHNTDCLCWKCLKEHNKDKIHIIKIGSLGYNSCFDNFSTQIQLCDDCYNENPEWWKLKTVEVKGFEQFGVAYEYDKEIGEYLSNLPLESQELVWNEYAYGACAGWSMNAQDWIDYHLGILSHKKCKKYGLYSPQEEQSYKERFPTCQYPVEVIYNDGSNGCHCPFGAMGRCKNGEVTAKDSVEGECYQCGHYKKRIGNVISISINDETDYNLYVKYHLNKDRLEQKFADKIII